MPVYSYIAVNAQKQKVKGKFIAANEKELASALAKQNLYLTSCNVERSDSPSAFFTTTGKVDTKELTAFCRQFAIMVTAGIPIVGCLENLKKQTYTSYFKALLQAVYEDVKSGSMLAAAFDKHKKVFPDFFRSMVHVGEASGKLEAVFVSLADYYESDAAVKRKVRSSLSYPLMLLGMTVAIVILMLTFVVPTFRDTMGKLEVEPEGYTKTVYDMSEWLVANWSMLLVWVIVIGFVLFLFFRTEKGKYVLDVLKIKTPFVAKVQRDLITARFSRAFSLLLSSGMDLASALDTVGLILGNRYLQKRFARVRADVRNGISLTTALKRYNFFPDMLIQMVGVGETTARLDEVLNRSCSYFDQRVEATLASVTSKIQPLMMLVMGVVIGSLFLAVYSPMLSIMNGL